MKCENPECGLNGCIEILLLLLSASLLNVLNVFTS